MATPAQLVASLAADMGLDVDLGAVWVALLLKLRAGRVARIGKAYRWTGGAS
jgi:hypothetical protein